MKVTVYTHPEFERKFKQYKKSTTRWYLTIVHFLTVLKRIHFKVGVLVKDYARFGSVWLPREEVRAEVCVSSLSQSIGLTKKT